MHGLLEGDKQSVPSNVNIHSYSFVAPHLMIEVPINSSCVEPELSALVTWKS